MGVSGFREKFEASDKLLARARQIIPGASHTYAKGEDQYPIRAPHFIARGQGCRVWDADGNEYIEYGMGNRAVGLGHAYGPVLDAVRAALDDGCNYARPAAIEVAAAEQLLKMVPAAEMVKFSKDGSDATSGAVKLARGYTGRDLVAICGDHPFFSVDDWFIGTTAMNGGVPQATIDLTVKFKYGDIENARALFAAHPGKIACVILEAARDTDPPPGYLQALKDLAHKEGALFILDEMITGFRWHKNGAQAFYDIEPDLSTFGKALANGFSVSALAGKREFMRLGGLDHTDRPRVFLMSTTHGGETHSLAAAIATMKVYDSEPVIEHVYRQGARLRAGMEEAIARHGVGECVKVIGKDCCLFFGTRDKAGQPSQPYRTLFLQELIKRGVIAPSLVISYAHKEADIDRTVEALDGALGVYARALEDGAEKYLVGPPSEVVYRAYNSAPRAR